MAGINKREKLQSVNTHRRSSSVGNSLIDEIVNTEPSPEQAAVEVVEKEQTKKATPENSITEPDQIQIPAVSNINIEELLSKAEEIKDDSHSVNVSVTLTENTKDELESFANIAIKANLSLEGCNGRISRSGIVQAALRDYIQGYYSKIKGFEEAVAKDIQENREKNRR